jgi:hypothetical protein
LLSQAVDEASEDADQLFAILFAQGFPDEAFRVVARCFEAFGEAQGLLGWLEAGATAVIGVGLAPDEVGGEKTVDEGRGGRLVGAQGFGELAQGDARRLDEREDGGRLALCELELGDALAVDTGGGASGAPEKAAELDAAPGSLLGFDSVLTFRALIVCRRKHSARWIFMQGPGKRIDNSEGAIDSA